VSRDAGKYANAPSRDIGKNTPSRARHARSPGRHALARCAWVGLGLGLALGCATGGSTWVNEPLTQRDEDREPSEGPLQLETQEPQGKPSGKRFATRVIGREDPGYRPVELPEDGAGPGIGPETPARAGRVLGTFRNTYYDFPNEADFKGETVPLFASTCKAIADVPRGFHDAVCVQGSGLLARGQTVSFARRDCECAEICPRTGHRICFDALDTSRFPWGRGALGKAITPLLTIAVDSSVIPMETPVYVPEFEGLPTDAGKRGRHDGCFIAQDRGSRVTGRHIDVFTGHSAVTKLWNTLVPSNTGVTVIVDNPRCARAKTH
jgi:hypothetical protein